MRNQRTVVVGVIVAVVMLLWGTARVMANGELITLLQEVTVPGNCMFFESAPVSTQNAQQVSLLGRAQGDGVEIQLAFTADSEQGRGPRLRSFGAACTMTENGIDQCPENVITSASPAVHSIGGPFMLVRILNCGSPAIITLKAFLLK
jgi:hypothetical protein